MRNIKTNATLAAFFAGLLFLTSGCQKSNNEKGEKLSIVTTLFPEYDFARAVAADKADIKMLLKPGADAHSFEPTPREIKEISKADLFIYTGSENDVWVEKVFDSIENPPRAVKLLDLVQTLEEEIVEGMETEEEDEEEAEIDEHVWTSPKNAATIVEKICGVLSEIDSSNADFYKKNADSYIEKINAVDEELLSVVNNAKRKTLVFGDRFPFRYFADEFGLEYYAAFPGCASDVEPSAKTVRFLIDKVKGEKIPVVFTIEFSNGKIADSICEATGAKKVELHSAHTVSADEFESGVTYVDIMKRNVASLKTAIE